MGVYGIRVFFMQYFGNINFNVRYCCIIYIVALRYAVFHYFLLTVFGEIRLFTVLQYRLFALSFRYDTQTKTQ